MAALIFPFTLEWVALRVCRFLQQGFQTQIVSITNTTNSIAEFQVGDQGKIQIFLYIKKNHKRFRLAALFPKTIILYIFFSSFQNSPTMIFRKLVCHITKWVYFLF